MNYTIKEVYIKEIEVEKSRFIGYLFPANSKEEFDDFLTKLRKENPKARHFCYAYIINDEKRGSDDGEPKGSAGIPLLNSLINKNLVNSAIIVIRYFGGTLLGAGRLLRTYLKSFEEVYKISSLLTLEPKKLIEVEIDYNCYDIFKNYLKNNQFDILKTEFNDKIILDFLSPLSFNENLIDTKFLYKVKVIKIDEYIKRKDL